MLRGNGGAAVTSLFTVAVTCETIITVIIKKKAKNGETADGLWIVSFHVRKITLGDVYANFLRAGAGFVSYRKLIINSGKVQGDLKMNGYCRIRKNFLKRLLQSSLVF